MRNLNEVVYLHLKPEYFLRELSLREWGKMISSYEGDSGAAVEIIAGNVYITTTLARVLEGHSVLDLRFNCGGRTRWHKPCPGVSYGEYGRKSLSEILDRAGMSLCDRREVYEEFYNAIGAGDEWSERCELYTGDDRVRYLYGADVFGLILVLDRMFSRDLSTSEIGRDYLRLRRSVLTRSVSCGKGERRDADGGSFFRCTRRIRCLRTCTRTLTGTCTRVSSSAHIFTSSAGLRGLTCFLGTKWRNRPWLC